MGELGGEMSHKFLQRLKYRIDSINLLTLPISLKLILSLYGALLAYIFSADLLTTSS